MSLELLHKLFGNERHMSLIYVSPDSIDHDVVVDLLSERGQGSKLARNLMDDE